MRANSFLEILKYNFTDEDIRINGEFVDHRILNLDKVRCVTVV